MGNETQKDAVLYDEIRKSSDDRVADPVAALTAMRFGPDGTPKNATDIDHIMTTYQADVLRLDKPVRVSGQTYTHRDAQRGDYWRIDDGHPVSAVADRVMYPTMPYKVFSKQACTYGLAMMIAVGFLIAMSTALYALYLQVYYPLGYYSH